MKLIGKGVHDCQRLSSPCTVSVMAKHNHVTMVLDVSEDAGIPQSGHFKRERDNKSS